MGDNSKIEWTDASWNPVVGCSHVSEGCRNCYAYSLHDMRHKAFSEGKKLPQQYAKPFNEVQTFEDRLDMPLKWKRPRKIFVNSLSDLFHKDIPFHFIEQVFLTMSLAKHHTFQILTKRPERMKEFFEKRVYNGHVPGNKPLSNVWLGVSVENQSAAEERIPLLVQTPAAVRFLSCEPLLGPLDFSKIYAGPNDELIDWVIVGGESGSKARPVHPDWIISIRDQCQEAGVPFFFKQWGEWIGFHEAAHSQCLSPRVEDLAKWHTFEEGGSMLRVGKQNAGRELDGRTWDEFPVVQVV